MSIRMDRDVSKAGLNWKRDTDRPARPNPVGWVLLGISALGLPMTLGAIGRMGRRGGLAAEIGYGILLTRATIVVAGGAPHRMKSATALLLYLELVADTIGFTTGLWTWVWSPLRSGYRAASTGTSQGPARIDERWIEHVAVLAAVPIYLLHTIRLAIYVIPGRGLRKE
jgi:hypothetical protein